MEFVLRLSPQEYNLIHKGLTKLSIEEALPTLNNIVAQAQSQICESSKPVVSEEKKES